MAVAVADDDYRLASSACSAKTVLARRVVFAARSQGAAQTNRQSGQPCWRLLHCLPIWHARAVSRCTCQARHAGRDCPLAVTRQPLGQVSAMSASSEHRPRKPSLRHCASTRNGPEPTTACAPWKIPPSPPLGRHLHVRPPSPAGARINVICPYIILVTSYTELSSMSPQLPSHVPPLRLLINEKPSPVANS